MRTSDIRFMRRGPQPIELPLEDESLLYSRCACLTHSFPIYYLILLYYYSLSSLCKQICIYSFCFYYPALLHFCSNH
jgi:hypothetical protein